jgi:hypothetical protein
VSCPECGESTRSQVPEEAAGNFGPQLTALIAYLTVVCRMPRRAQFCWAHLKRNLVGIVEFPKNSAVERFCREALAEHARLFRLWHKFRGGQIARGQLLLRSIPLPKRTVALAERHLDSLRCEIRNLATALFEHTGRLLLASNNRALRPPTTALNEGSALVYSGASTVRISASFAPRP